jgi:sensor histidine kinase YesM
MKVEKRSKQIESDRMAMELSLLRSQINPHFLFNTLNSIYSLALMKSEMTAHAVMQLSDIMRYMTEDSSSEKVILSKEVDYIQHYVELQRIRLGINAPVILTVEGEFGGYFIPPLILMPFVENAFKYGISNHEQAPINIFIRVENHHLLFQVKNLIFKDRISPVTTGLGITNTRKRLERIYSGRHTLDITENSRLFMVTLTLRLV